MICNTADEVKKYLDLGRSCFLRGKPFESLGFYAKAVQLSSDEPALEEALRAIGRASDTGKLLKLGLAVKFPLSFAGKMSLDWVKRSVSSNFELIKAPVAIVAGGSSFEVEAQMRSYQGLLLDVFRGFSGTIISGGTVSGVGGLIGEVQRNFPKVIRTIGYVPKAKGDLLDERFAEIRFTDGDEFSVAEPLQYWVDIVASGIEPRDVKVLGFNGGKISAAGYRIGLALGARVGVVKGSGLEADGLLLDCDWCGLPNVFSLLNSSSSVRSFLFA
jgi:hypothetical protein